MDTKLQSIRGMRDYLPDETEIFRKIEDCLISVLKTHSIKEIKLPIIEYTDLFYKTIGIGTDILEKEMYTFYNKGNKSITLRPEGTAGCVRSALQNNLFSRFLEHKIWYLGPMFRCERPQKGRYRQFYQLGIEIFGLKGIAIELELLIIAYKWWKKLGIQNLIYLEINSIGSCIERENFKKVLINFFKKYESKFDEEMKKTLSNNPLRLLDSKKPLIQSIIHYAPKLFDYLYDDTKIQFQELCSLLNLMNIPFIVNKNLIRGLDYYNNMVFEWKIHKEQSQNAICAGGRYDNLVEQLGGSHVPALGCAVGLDRLYLLIKQSKIFVNTNDNLDIIIVFLDQKYIAYSFKIAEIIRNEFTKLKVKIDFKENKLTKKIQNANKCLTKFMLIIGKKEFEQNAIIIKNLISHTQILISIEQLTSYLKTVL
ncbi:Histidine--tRNA ligase [Buchnera aphidicola (Thelaxes suberi)]|uniref:histidine--tRNA ligase n=1 Tax=Buchnera aphidicola TaxID=9 RepID=UPI0034638B2B